MAVDVSSVCEVDGLTSCVVSLYFYYQHLWVNCFTLCSSPCLSVWGWEFVGTYFWLHPRPIRSLVTQGMKVIATNTRALAKLERFYCVVGANVVKPPLSSQFFIVAVVRVRDSVEGNRTTTSSSRCEWATESLAQGHDACFIQSDHNNKHLESSSL